MVLFCRAVDTSYSVTGDTMCGRLHIHSRVAASAAGPDGHDTSTHDGFWGFDKRGRFKGARKRLQQRYGYLRAGDNGVGRLEEAERRNEPREVPLFFIFLEYKMIQTDLCPRREYSHSYA